MFVTSQNFPGSRGRNFVVSVIGIILIRIKQMIVDRFVEIFIRGQELSTKATKASNIGLPRTMMTPQ